MFKIFSLLISTLLICLSTYTTLQKYSFEISGKTVSKKIFTNDERVYIRLTTPKGEILALKNKGKQTGSYISVPYNENSKIPNTDLIGKKLLNFLLKTCPNDENYDVFFKVSSEKTFKEGTHSIGIISFFITN